LERALEQVNDAISITNVAKRGKKKDADEWLIGPKVSALLRKLEMDAQDRGETGLAISLSKPFRRLLKYPMLFQALLFYTDPGMFEYESTLQVIAEIENVIRDIEGAKNQKEERDKTHDVLARIKGLDKVKQFAIPKPSRVLVEEVILNLRVSSDAYQASRPSVGITRPVGGKTSFKRLSDVLQSSEGGISSQKDVWLVVFNDVVLRCQRTGTTTLPLGAVHSSRANSQSERGKSKYATTDRRNSFGRPRNLYRFIKVSVSSS
jgi:RhoGEF domain